MMKPEENIQEHDITYSCINCYKDDAIRNFDGQIRKIIKWVVDLRAFKRKKKRLILSMLKASPCNLSK